MANNGAFQFLCRIVQRTTAGQNIHLARGQPKAFTLITLEDVRQEVGEKDRAGDSFTGRALRSYLSATRQTVAVQRKSLNPEAMLPKLSRATLDKYSKVVAPDEATAKFRSMSRKKALLRMENPITFYAVVSSLPPLFSEFMFCLDSVGIELGDSMSDRVRIMLAKESRAWLASLGLNPSAARDREKYRVVHPLMCHNAAGQLIYTAILIRDDTFDPGCTAYSVSMNGDVEVWLIGTGVDRIALFRAYLKSLIGFIKEMRDPFLEMINSIVPIAPDVDRLAASDASSASIAASEDAEEPVDANAQSHTAQDYESSGSDSEYVPSSGADSSSVHTDNDTADESSDIVGLLEQDRSRPLTKDGDVTMLELAAYVFMDGEDAQIKVAQEKEIVKLCAGALVTLVKSAAACSMTQAPADTSMAHPLIHGYYRSDAYKTDGGTVETNALMGQFLKNVFSKLAMPKASRDVYVKFLRHWPRASSKAWTVSVSQGGWASAGIRPLNWRQIMSKDAGWMTMPAADVGNLKAYEDACIESSALFFYHVCVAYSDQILAAVHGVYGQTRQPP
ncbi:MAG: hypothetical protein WCR59_09530 [Planctomycetota bacterium]